MGQSNHWVLGNDRAPQLKKTYFQTTLGILQLCSRRLWKDSIRAKESKTKDSRYNAVTYKTVERKSRQVTRIFNIKQKTWELFRGNSNSFESIRVNWTNPQKSQSFPQQLDRKYRSGGIYSYIFAFEKIIYQIKTTRLNKENTEKKLYTLFGLFSPLGHFLGHFCQRFWWGVQQHLKPEHFHHLKLLF